jgi:hypothetical protein
LSQSERVELEKQTGGCVACFSRTSCVKGARREVRDSSTEKATRAAKRSIAS